MDLGKEEANESHGRSTNRQQQQEIARITREEEGTEGGEEESTETKGGKGKRRGGSAMVGPVQSRYLDDGGTGHAATQAGQVRKEAQERNMSRAPVVCDVEGEVSHTKQNCPRKNSRAGTFVIDEHTDRNPQSIHAQVAKESDQIALRDRELEALCKLRSPRRVDILYEVDSERLESEEREETMGTHVGTAGESDKCGRDTGNDAPTVYGNVCGHGCNFGNGPESQLSELRRAELD